jgi:hypothetical protein
MSERTRIYFCRTDDIDLLYDRVSTVLAKCNGLHPQSSLALIDIINNLNVTVPTYEEDKKRVLQNIFQTLSSCSLSSKAILR